MRELPKETNPRVTEDTEKRTQKKDKSIKPIVEENQVLLSLFLPSVFSVTLGLNPVV
jgi:hypothetical protein